VIGPSQRSLPDNTQHSQETDFHATGGNRTRNPSKRATADPRLKTRGHWNRQLWKLLCNIIHLSVPYFLWCFQNISSASCSQIPSMFYPTELNAVNFWKTKHYFTIYSGEDKSYEYYPRKWCIINIVRQNKWRYEMSHAWHILIKTIIRSDKIRRKFGMNRWDKRYIQNFRRKPKSIKYRLGDRGIDGKIILNREEN
jgi:hypothetical protein